MKFSRAADKLTGSSMFQFLSRAQELEKAGKKIYHFELGDPDFETPEHIKRAGIAAIEQGDTHYANSQGILKLREAIAEETYKQLGFRPETKQVVVAPAVSFIYFLTRALLDPDDEVLVPDPGFASYYSAFDFIGAKYVNVPLLEKNEFRMNPSDVRKRITARTRLIIINSPNNPTGAVMTNQEMDEISEIAREHEIFLLSDEVYDKLIYDDYDYYSPAKIDKCQERTIILNSFSKSYAMTGWRLGWVVAPLALAEKLDLMIQTIIYAVPPFIQKAGVAALTGDQSFIEKNIIEYKVRRDLMVELLNNIPGVSCLPPKGAFYVFPNIQGTGMTSAEFSEFALLQAGVVVTPGTAFGSAGEGYVRLAYATSQQDISEGLEKLKQALPSR